MDVTEAAASSKAELKAELKARQAPLKERYRSEPGSAVVTLSADGELDGSGIACKVRTSTALVEAGLHPATGGDGTQLCSGDMLLEALVACAGVTLRAVATSLGMAVSGTVHAEGDLDFRGTLGVSKDAPVGFRDIRLSFALDTDADADQVATLVKLTERYCVVLQTLTTSPATSVSVSTG
ncbi:OsmC family protein [Pseudonocardia sp. CA-107938]|uniref:OsmC family protein n=1 Tax=Pseudonocardia sp. CA-107938 TaxID=3240021 RepID=UPI003D904383